MIYTTCRYVPIELFAGFGVEVKRLDPNPTNFYCAEMNAHANICSYVKAILEEIHHEQVQEIVITDCCDSSRRLYDILLQRKDMKFVYLLPLPHQHRKEDIVLFQKELLKLKDAYQAYSGKEFDIEKVYTFLEDQQGDAYSPKGDYIEIKGAHCGNYLKNQVSKYLKYQVEVIDHSCTGERVLLPYDKQQDFFVWYAEALLTQSSPCYRMYDQKNEQNNTKNCLGIIYHTVKFCDYYSFEFMKLSKQNELPILKVETDKTPTSTGQLKTRIEAFAEELGLNKETVKIRKKDGPIYVAGIDIGSSSTDVIVMNASKKIIGRIVVPTVGGACVNVQKALKEALAQAWLREDDLSAIVTTGYGRDHSMLDSTSITEITCHAKGAHYLDPSIRTVVDIGGQDSKVIKIDEDGNVVNFMMNDKCAAGTGRFLEMQARALGLTLEKMSHKGLEWSNEVKVSSMCSVFAESEVVSLVARNVAVADIIHGLNEAIAEKTYSLVSHVDHEPGYMMTGGVAQNEGVVLALEKKIGKKIKVSNDSQLCGAIGAALLALEALV